MKAAVLTSYGQASTSFEIRDEAPPHLDKGNVIISVEMFGLNYADVMARKGLYKAAPSLPAILGYEVVGVVKSICSSLPQHMIGKRVVCMTRFGGYAEEVSVSFESIVEVPLSVSSEEACALATQYSTAFYMSKVATNILDDDLVLIHAAAGGVGIALKQLLPNNRCIGLVGSNKKKELISGDGFVEIINYNEVNYYDGLSAPKFDVIFNSVGGKSFKNDYSLLANNGKLFLYGVASLSRGKVSLFKKMKTIFSMGFYNPIKLLSKSNSFIGVNMLSVADHQPKVIKHCLVEVLKLAEQKLIKPVISKVYNIDEISEAHEMMENGIYKGKIIVKF
jgi:NADPH:quinone reductase-like Zn-dependent oxidoreductase